MEEVEGDLNFGHSALSVGGLEDRYIVCLYFDELMFEVVLNTLRVENGLQFLRVERHCEEERIALEELDVRVESFALPVISGAVDDLLRSTWTGYRIARLSENSSFKLGRLCFLKLVDGLVVVHRAHVSA